MNDPAFLSKEIIPEVLRCHVPYTLGEIEDIWSAKLLI